MFSLPVPLARSVKTYNDIRKGRDESTMVRLVEDLTGGNIGRDALAHLAPGWRACFGQTDAAQTHLEGCGVGRGDLFLFFGWFRESAKHTMADGPSTETAPISTSSLAGCRSVR